MICYTVKVCESLVYRRRPEGDRTARDSKLRSARGLLGSRVNESLCLKGNTYFSNFSVKTSRMMMFSKPSKIILAMQGRPMEAFC